MTDEKKELDNDIDIDALFDVSEDFIKDVNEEIDQKEKEAQEEIITEDLSKFEIVTEPIKAEEAPVTGEEEKAPSTEGDVNEASEAAILDEDFIPELDFSNVDMEYHEEDEAKSESELLFESIDIALAAQVDKAFGASDDEDEEEEDEDSSNIWLAIPAWIRTVVIILLSLIAICIFFIFSKPGHAIITRIATEIAWTGINRAETLEPTHIPVEELPDDENIIIHNPESTPLPTVEISNEVFEEDSSVINVLLIGVENNYNDSRGRSDSMMIASIDKDGGPVKVVSLMRDMYVEIPGYQDNKLNAAYSIGGAPLLVETVEKNFKIDIDSYVMINYGGFEAVIDSIGGLEISLTQEEAKYLQTHDYISDPAQRNVVPGNQKMTGNQVLGYCRVRYVPTANGLYSDFGRTYRQRLVLTKIFEKYKAASYSELINLMTTCLSFVTAPDELKGIAATCLQTVVEKKMFNLDTYRIPANGHYSDAKIDKKQVIIYYPDNAKILHDYLYDFENFDENNYKQ